MCFQMFRGRGDTSPRFLASSQTLQPKRRRWRRSEPAAFKLDEAVFPPQDRCKTTPLIVSLCGGASQRNNQHSAINQHGVCVFDGCRAACRLNGWSTTSSAPGPDNIQPVEEGRGRGGRLGMGGGWLVRLWDSQTHPNYFFLHSLQYRKKSDFSDTISAEANPSNIRR